MTKGVSTYVTAIVTSVSAQLLPMLRSTVGLTELNGAGIRRRLDAPAERRLERELTGRFVPAGNGNPRELKWIRTGRVDAAETPTAAAEPCGFHQRAIGIDDVVAAAV